MGQKFVGQKYVVENSSDKSLSNKHSSDNISSNNISSEKYVRQNFGGQRHARQKFVLQNFTGQICRTKIHLKKLIFFQEVFVNTFLVCCHIIQNIFFYIFQTVSAITHDNNRIENEIDFLRKELQHLAEVLTNHRCAMKR